MYQYFVFGIWFPLTSNVADRSLNLKCTYLGCLGLVAGDTQCWPGVCPTDGISIGFGFRLGFGVLWFGVCSADRGAVLHTSRPLHCRDVCEIWLWSVVERFEPERCTFWSVSGSVGVLLVGRAPELWNRHMYVNSHDQNIFHFLFLFWISVVR